MRGQHCSGQQGGAEAIDAESGSCRRAALCQQGISLDTAFRDAAKHNSFFHACHWEVWTALIGKEKSLCTHGFPSCHGCGCSAAFLLLCKQAWNLLLPYYHYHPTAPAAVGLPWSTTLLGGLTTTGTAALQENTAWWGDGTQGTLTSTLTKQSLIGYQKVHEYCL